MLKSLDILLQSKVCQCYNGSLYAYLDKCLDIISSFDEFIIKHIPREENGKANTLAQQASGYNVTKKYFNIRKPMQTKAGFLVLDAPVRPPRPVGPVGPVCQEPETRLSFASACEC